MNSFAVPPGSSVIGFKANLDPDGLQLQLQEKKIEIISESLYISPSKDHIHQSAGVHFQVF